MGSPATKHTVRRDIEGLRAVAVLAVVTNHIIPATLGGGFCGVDVFFVISGYLIGMHLLEDIQAGKFSFLKFYARRARRLLPALVVVLLAVWFGAWIVLMPKEFAALGRHIAASAVFANNFLLSTESGYFDAPSTAKPLLHLWSLGVEEQFYVLVPFLLWLGSRGRQGSIRWVVWLGALSLLVTVCAAVPSFYLLDQRLWELAVGVTIGYLALRASVPPVGARPLARMDHREVMACAFVLMLAVALAYESKPRPWSHDALLATGGLGIVFVLAGSTTQVAGTQWPSGAWMRLAAVARTDVLLLREISAIGGLTAIAVSLFAMTPADWPGPQTVLPVLGTALVISAGPRSSVNRLLGVAPLVFLGAISYPLYLWHWPIIVFYRMVHYEGSAAGALIPILVAIILAWATRELIESPARFGRLCGKAVRVPPVRVLACALLLSGLLGVSAIATQGYPSRLSPQLRALANTPSTHDEYQSSGAIKCYFHPGGSHPVPRECTPAKRAGVPRVLLWGDSHAAHLYPGLLSLQKEYDFDLIQWTAPGCPPTRTHWAAELPGCDERRAWELPQLNQLVPDGALLSARWDLYLSLGTPQEQILASVRDDIHWLRQLGVRSIVLFGPGPTWNSSLAADLVRYMRMRHTEQIPDRLGRVSDMVRRLDAAMAREAVAAQVQYISVLDVFCDPRGCLTVGDPHAVPPELLFWDSDHLTTRGSRFLVTAAADSIRSLKKHSSGGLFGENGPE